MKKNNVTNVICSKCGADLIDLPSTDPCHKCNSTARSVEITIKETLEVHDSLKGKINSESFNELRRKLKKRKRDKVEFIHGEEKFKTKNTWVKKDRIINREKNTYFEKITCLRTGNIIHSCEEPLNKHTKHGGDKK